MIDNNEVKLYLFYKINFNYYENRMKRELMNYMNL